MSGDFIDPLRFVRKSKLEFGKVFIEEMKEALQAAREATQVRRGSASPVDENLRENLKIFNEKRLIPYFDEYERLLAKAHNEGLFLEEKCRLMALVARNEYLYH